MNGTGWIWPGASWWLCDLHTHTPGSFDFEDRETVTATDWVAAAKAAGLQVVAVTDHSTNAWVEELHDPGLTVFPGVELTVTPGVHLLAILDPGNVVNGDAEYVVALNVPAGEVLVEKDGGLQEQAVRDEICRVMEGGAEAFRERFRRIAAGAGDV